MVVQDSYGEKLFLVVDYLLIDLKDIGSKEIRFVSI